MTTPDRPEKNQPSENPSSGERAARLNFIQEIVEDDLRTGKWGGRVHTRFPPEPNGYLHIGHAKSICLNFGLAQKYAGLCNMRFDDTNPTKEEEEYVQSILADIRWLGFDWQDRLYFASDYFEQLYEWAVQLIRDGKAYVCDLTPDQVREHRGTLTQPVLHRAPHLLGLPAQLMGFAGLQMPGVERDDAVGVGACPGRVDLRQQGQLGPALAQCLLLQQPLARAGFVVHRTGVDRAFKPLRIAVAADGQCRRCQPQQLQQAGRTERHSAARVPGDGPWP